MNKNFSEVTMDKKSVDISNIEVVYHTTSAPLESLKKYGLCSPKDLYIKDAKEFENGTKKRYLGRVAIYLDKPENEVTNNDILNYLDTYRPPCTSKSCFFSFNKPKPNKINPITKQRNITFAIPIETLKKYAISNPILSKELKFTTISWNDLKNNLSKYEEQAYKDIPNSDGYYRNILHLAVNINTIPFKELIPVTDETVGNENIDNSLIKVNQLLDHMKTFTYGIYKEHNTWYIQSPENLEKSKLGVCHDFSLYAYYHLTKNGYNCKLMYLTNSSVTKTHSFVIMTIHNKQYWFESAWEDYVGIHELKNGYKDIVSLWAKDEHIDINDIAVNSNVNTSELLKNKNIPYKTYFNVVQKPFVQGNENMKNLVSNESLSTNKRQQIEEKILATMKIMEPGLTNYNRYEKMFKEMSDEQFDRFMNDLKDGKIKLTLLTPNLKVFIKQEDLLNAADSLGLELFEKLRFKDKSTGKYFWTPNKYLITKLPVRRTRQFLMHKLSIAENDKRIDALTGQVTSDDKASSISYPEAQLMYARGLNNCITEFMKVRGGDIHAFATFKQQLEETGSIRMESLDQNTIPRSAVVLSAVLKSMYFDNNLV